MKRLLAVLTVVVSFAVTAVVAQPVGASADPGYPVTEFRVKGPFNLEANGYTYGYITWYNRTAQVSGNVVIADNLSSTTAVFEAFAGSVKVDSTTRTVNGDHSSGIRGFNFTIGDTNRPGGIDRIKITVNGWNSVNYP